MCGDSSLVATEPFLVLKAKIPRNCLFAVKKRTSIPAESVWRWIMSMLLQGLKIQNENQVLFSAVMLY